MKTLKSNEFWGKRSGGFSPPHGKSFMQAQHGSGSSNSTPKKRGLASRKSVAGIGDGSVHHSKKRQTRI